MTTTPNTRDLASAPRDEGPRPSRVRFRVLGLLGLLTAILYLDRVCISQALPAIQSDLRLSNTQMGFVLAAFMLAYGLFEVPTGRWGDRFGARRVLARIAIWWSAFTILTGVCWDLASLLVVRFLFGAGEAGAYPNIARVIARWYPAQERGRVQGLLTFTALIGATAAPVLAGYLIAFVGWRPTFAIFGMTGLFWALAFRSRFRDDPAEHPFVNAAERDLIRPPGTSPGATHERIPWGAVVRSRTIWLLGLSMTCSAFNSYLYYSWFPKYLQAARDVGPVEAGWLASGVLFGGACGMLLGGFLVDGYCGHGTGSTGRRSRLGFAANVLAAACLMPIVSAESATVSSLAAGLSCLAASTVNPLWWASATEVSGRHIGALFGLMNSLGLVGGIASQLFFGAFADWRAQAGYLGRARWDPAFYVDLVVLLLGATCWLWIDSTRSVDASDSSRQGSSDVE